MKKAKGSTPDTKKDWHGYCPHDGSPLRADGYCTKADGFPLMRWFWHPDAKQGKGAWEAQGWACPYVCPECRKCLEWDGCCFSCGPKLGAPGDRYRRERNHWIYERGPEAPMTIEQHAALLVKFKALTASLA